MTCRPSPAPHTRLNRNRRRALFAIPSARIGQREQDAHVHQSSAEAHGREAQETRDALSGEAEPEQVQEVFDVDPQRYLALAAPARLEDVADLLDAPYGAAHEHLEEDL